MPTTRLPIRFLAALAVSAHSAALAQDTGVVYAGGGVGDGRNVYAGGVIALPGATLGNGLALRSGGSGGSYRYNSAGSEIEGDYVSGELALVYQTSGDWGWANYGLGPRVTDTTLEPADPANERVGTRWDVALQTDGALGYHWRLGWFGSVGVRDKAYITEVRLGPLIHERSQTRVGAEVGLAGDETYTRGSLGLFASTQIAAKTELRLSGGASEQAGRKARPYAALALSRTF